MPHLDTKPANYIIPDTPIYSIFITYAPLRPLDLYAFSGHHRLHDLAVQCSSHLLTISPADISDEQASRMGAIYLKKLLCLHLARMKELRDMLLKVPEFHPENEDCSFLNQRIVSSAWSLATAGVIWDAAPGK